MTTPLRDQIAADLATLREIEARAQKNIAELQRSGFNAQSDEVRAVLREATRCLRLHGTKGSKEHVWALHEIVRILEPELYKLLEDEDYRQADRVTHPEEDE
jgi:uncharacterized circularly permuted ATP-grasp superfamily protein